MAERWNAEPSDRSTSWLWARRMIVVGGLVVLGCEALVVLWSVRDISATIWGVWRLSYLAAIPTGLLMAGLAWGGSALRRDAELRTRRNVALLGAGTIIGVPWAGITAFFFLAPYVLQFF